MHQNHRHHRLKSWPDLWFSEKPLNHVLFKMHQTLTLDPSKYRSGSRSRSPCPRGRDITSLLSDDLLLHILSNVPDHLRDSTALVCKRWLRLNGRLRRNLTLLSWSFLDRLITRFPNLTDIDLVPAAFSIPSSSSRVLLNRGPFSVPMDPHTELPIGDFPFLNSDSIDRGLEILAKGCPGLRKLCIAAAASESGLMAVANKCSTLQEMELHRCTDLTLRPISAFKNLQILKLVGSIEGLYTGPGFTDIGLTILAHGCKRLVKLELSGCEGSYDGISAVGRCCLMLEELTICDHRMDAGWIAGLSFCGNLKTLRLHQGCRRIDNDPGPQEHLGFCPTIERIQLQRCQLGDIKSLKALFVMCESVREIVFQNCWGLDDEMFGITSICRRVKFLLLEGCSQLTTEGLESVILSWTDLKRLTVVSCNNVRDDAVTPALSSLFSVLKEFKWRPDSKSVLAMSLAGTGMGNKGGRIFRRG